MPVDLPAILKRDLQRAAEHGCGPRRVILVVDLPGAAPGGNVRVVDSTHYVSFADVAEDPGVLGAVAQFAMRNADA